MNDQEGIFGQALVDVIVRLLHNSEVSKLFETQVAEFQKASTEAMSQLTKNAPAGSEAIVKAMQDAFAKATTAFGTASAMTKQFTDATQVAVKAATSKAKSK